MRMETVSMRIRERWEGREHEIMELGEFVREKVNRKNFFLFSIMRHPENFLFRNFFSSSFLTHILLLARWIVGGKKMINVSSYYIDIHTQQSPWFLLGECLTSAATLKKLHYYPSCMSMRNCLSYEVLKKFKNNNILITLSSAPIEKIKNYKY